jgi:NADH dehydrogenase [ubiquinone] 1 alpha subcomplex assembly factor 6
LRQKDYDYWLAGLLMPSKARRAFYAVRSFNVETASIVDSVRGNVIPGKLRVQWWRDVVHKCYTDGRSDLPQGYPVLACLADAVATHNLSRRWLDKSLDARERDLEIDQPQSMEVALSFCTRPFFVPGEYDLNYGRSLSLVLRRDF